MNHARPAAFLATILATILVSGCLFDKEDSYSITFGNTGSVNAVAAYPENVGGEITASDSNRFFIPFISAAERASDTAYQDHKQPEEVPSYTSVFCITATTRYRLRYRIVDAENRFAFQGESDFGYAGELKNYERITPKGLEGCLEWPLTVTDSLYTTDFRKPGLYRWQVAFSFEDPTKNFVAERAFTILRWPNVYRWPF